MVKLEMTETTGDRPQICFSIDRGGTFTDVYAEVLPEGKILTEKLLSEDPAHYPDAPREGIRRILAKLSLEHSVENKNISTDHIHWIRMGTTVATNALLERKGVPTVLVITKGFKDLLFIGDQTRPDLFDLKIIKPDNLYSQAIEIDERVRPYSPSDGPGAQIVTGQTGEKLSLLATPDRKIIKDQLQSIYNQGIRSIAVVLMHSYTWYEHELLVGQVAKEIGFSQISLSHQVMPRVKIVARGDTTTVDAYLTPHIHQYLESFCSGFVDGLAHTPLLFMQSDGGLTAASHFKGSNAILSGPAGGVVGYATTTDTGKDKKQPLIGFDMGGTSTDVSRFNTSYELTQETITAGVRIQAPQMQIKTVAAGGGSRLFFRNNMLSVGPESAGAHPGPVCYRKNGFLTVTDANLFLGRLQADFFPCIFGPDEDLPLDLAAVTSQLQKITAEINAAQPADQRAKSCEEVALGFLDIANEEMVRPIRELSVMRGYDSKEHILACFGGAGGQHACSVARRLGITTIFIHQHAGILSALGMARADIIIDKQEAWGSDLDQKKMTRVTSALAGLEQKNRTNLEQQGAKNLIITVHNYLNLRFQGTDTSMMIELRQGVDPGETFQKSYQREFGFILDRPVIIDDIRVRLIGASRHQEITTSKKQCSATKPLAIRPCYFKDGWLDTPVYDIGDLPDQPVSGPAIILQGSSTILLEPDCSCRLTRHGDLLLTLHHKKQELLSTAVDPVQLSIFSNLFMSVAEQMGRTLQKTAISTNIKERLDFSCALFDQFGRLVANAPHVPVHLGAMGQAVRKQIEINRGSLEAGDVLVSNHPAAGGSHLPDITVITPLIQNNKTLFYVASRGHHADIGGISPGSMPPFSKTLAEEGAAILSFKLVSQGVFQEDGINKLLTGFADPVRGISPARHLEDNISDLKAQSAANNRGINLLEELITSHSLPVLQAYMGHIQDNAEQAVRTMLKQLGKNTNSDNQTLIATDRLDDGTKIKLTISINADSGSATFDFSGSGTQLTSNLNCPPAVVSSAILYCLRCLVNTPIPLNQGCLNPVTIITPEGSLLNPSYDAAVAGGNVLTSQRITDVIFKAFNAAAASQGCMNNLTFGNDKFGYYETIGGGAGAGPSWHGQSGVHTHMTNTRITDPEILERRYPVMVEQFSLRSYSGGLGLFNGGEGLIRQLTFLAPLNVSMLSERRVFSPYGLSGGNPGAKGRNTIIKKDGSSFDMGGKNSLELEAGDSIRIETPGGGGYGIEKVTDI